MIGAVDWPVGNDLVKLSGMTVVFVYVRTCGHPNLAAF